MITNPITLQDIITPTSNPTTAAAASLNDKIKNGIKHILPKSFHQSTTGKSRKFEIVGFTHGQNIMWTILYELFLRQVDDFVVAAKNEKTAIKLIQ